MFGFLYIAFMIIATSIAGTIACKQNFERRKWWRNLSKKENPNRIYYDRKGVRRDLVTSEPIDIIHSYRTGDAIKVIGFDRKTMINISERWRKEHFEIAQHNHNKYSVFPDIHILHNYPNDITEREDHEWDTRWYALGQWWRDLESSDLYCIRTIKANYKENVFDINFYLDIETGLLVRPADDHDFERIQKEICDEVMIKYNEKKKKKHKPSNNLEWNMFYENSHVAKWSGYAYLSDVIKSMQEDGCSPTI